MGIPVVGQAVQIHKVCINVHLSQYVNLKEILQENKLILI